MDTTKQIADSYRAATVSGAWHGPSLGELLGKISPEQAIIPPAPKGNSIATLLQHLLLWNERIRKTSESSPLPRWEPEKEWGEPAIPWGDLLLRWSRSRDLMEERLRSFPTSDLAKTVPGRDYPYEKMLRGSVDHVIYHSGQIAMVASMLRRKP